MIEEDLIIEMWDLFKEYIPEKSRETAAEQYIEYLLEKEVDEVSIEGLAGYDPDLDEAIKLVLNTEEEEDDDYDEYDDDDQEDEDY